MKKLFLFSILALLLLTSNNVMAAEYDNVDYNKLEYTDFEREITKEEAINLIMEKKDMTYEEAVKDLGFDSVFYLLDYAPLRAISYVERTRVYKNYTSEIEIGGVFEVYNSGSFRSIEKCNSMFTRAKGSGFYTWNESYITDITPKYPTQLASLQASGVIEYVLNPSIDVSVGKDLLSAGFSLSGSYTYRKVINMNLDYRMY